MTSKESSDNTGYVVSIKILDVEKRYKPGPKHYVYVIQVTWANPANIFIVYRRYAQFFDLQCKLLDLFAEIPSQSNGSTPLRQIPFLPGKIILGRSQIRQIALERKQALDEYCQTLISLTEHISRSRPILEFFHPSATDVQKPTESIAQEKKPIAKNSLIISEPSKLATYRCLADFTATEKLELSLKRNNIVQVLQKRANGWWFVQYEDQTGFVPGAYLEPSELQRGDREGKTFEKSLNEMYVVNKQYQGTGQDELSLDQGSFVTVIEKSFTGWWTVQFNNSTGQFPAICLSSCEGRHTPENVINDTSSLSSNIQNSNDSDDSDWDDDEEEEYHTEPSNGTKVELYYAHSHFVDDVGDCLSFQRGDLIEIHDKHPSGWWFGRQMKDGHVLSWIPASYLQKEPVLDAGIENSTNQSSNSEHHSNMPDIVSNSPLNKQKEEILTDSIYQNFESQNSTDEIYSKITKKQPPIETTIAHEKSPISIPLLPPVNINQKPTIANKKSPISTPRSPVNDMQESTPKSVKDLVKRFNQK